MCKPLEDGGLGVKDVRIFNNALLAKWKWQLMNDERRKWKDILDSKYGSEVGRSHTRLKWQSWWWRDLSKACGEGEDEWFQKSVVWKVGDGGNVKFWEDAWVTNNNLKSLYPRLFFSFYGSRYEGGRGRYMGELWMAMAAKLEEG